MMQRRSFALSTMAGITGVCALPGAALQIEYLDIEDFQRTQNFKFSGDGAAAHGWPDFVDSRLLVRGTVKGRNATGVHSAGDSELTSG